MSDFLAEENRRIVISDIAPAAEPEEGAGADINEYLKEEHRRFGLQELTHVKSLAYFLPLLHELFNAGEAKTCVVFTMLHALMVDDRVRWTRGDLDEKFHWLRDTPRNYLLHRLSNVGWLEYYRDQGMYMVSDKGEALMRILSRFAYGRRLAENEGAALAEIEFSQLLEFPDVTERLKFLRNRLCKHIIRAETALRSESPYRILEIYEQLKSAYRWAEQTRNTLDQLDVEDDDNDGWTTIRGVHDNLSRLHSLISKMQLVLQDIQRKQIDIARYGLTHLDFDNYLINSNIDVLSEMVRQHFCKVPHPLFTLQGNLFQEAAEILQRERRDTGEGRGWDTSSSEPPADAGEPTARETADFVADLKTLPCAWRQLDRLITGVDWEIAAYRFSLLTLMANDRARDRVADHDPLMVHAPDVEFDETGEMTSVSHGAETWRMTKGRVRRTRRKTSAEKT